MILFMCHSTGVVFTHCRQLSKDLIVSLSTLSTVSKTHNFVPISLPDYEKMTQFD